MEELVERFEGPGPFRSARPMGSGHINDTYLVEYENGPDQVLQRLNTHVFPRPDHVMDNIGRVTTHLASKQHLGLKLIPTRCGQNWIQDSQGQCWRMYEKVTPSRSFETLQTPRQAYQVGFAFSQFQGQLADLPEPRLHETILDFHHTPKRAQRLHQAVVEDRVGRVAQVKREVEQALAWEQVGRLLSLGLPERITHNDTKLNNLLFDEQGHQPICVVDLDTVMPGLIHYDFGDMVRTGCATAAEDEADLAKVGFSAEFFEALTSGYLEGGLNFLTIPEVEELAFSGVLLTFELGLRFLTDYLEGDHYFKVHYPEHNLVRARSQFELARQLELRQGELKDQTLKRWLELRRALGR